MFKIAKCTTFSYYNKNPHTINNAKTQTELSTQFNFCLWFEYLFETAIYPRDPLNGKILLTYSNKLHKLFRNHTKIFKTLKSIKSSTHYNPAFLLFSDSSFKLLPSKYINLYIKNIPTNRLKQRKTKPLLLYSKLLPERKTTNKFLNSPISDLNGMNLIISAFRPDWKQLNSPSTKIWNSQHFLLFFNKNPNVYL